MINTLEPETVEQGTLAPTVEGEPQMWKTKIIIYSILGLSLLCVICLIFSSTGDDSLIPLILPDHSGNLNTSKVSEMLAEYRPITYAKGVVIEAPSPQMMHG